MKSALVIAHPGHELRLAAWVAASRPLVFIIAKGSRAGRNEDRVAVSRAMALELGAVPAEPFGAAFDSEIYGWILAGDTAAFGRLADQLRDAFVEGEVSQVVTDGWQNYNPVHDLTHLLARVAAAEAARRLGRPVESLDYPVVLGDFAQAPRGAERARMALSPADLDAKLALVARYPGIAEDVSALMDAEGRGALDPEVLHALLPLDALTPTEDAPPWYQAYGEERVRAGVYDRALGWSHMAPIVAALAARLAAAEGL